MNLKLLEGVGLKIFTYADHFLTQRNAGQGLPGNSRPKNENMGDIVMCNHARFGPILATATILTVAATAFSAAQSAPIDINIRLPASSEQFKMIEPAHYVWGGRGYCWHDGGWNGPGWYRCGYAARNGQGWGGPQGWHGWHWQGASGPQHWGHHYSMHRSMHGNWGRHNGGQGCCW